MYVMVCMSLAYNYKYEMFSHHETILCDGGGSFLHAAQNLNIQDLTPTTLPPPNGRTSRLWDSLLPMKSGCAGGRGFTPLPGQY